MPFYFSSTKRAKQRDQDLLNSAAIPFRSREDAIERLMAFHNYDSTLPGCDGQEKKKKGEKKRKKIKE